VKRVALTAVAAISLSLTVAGPAAAAPVPLDTTFSGDGKAALNQAGWQYVYGILADGDSPIAYGGTAADWNRSPRAQMVTRYQPDGRLDTSFSGDGIKTLRYTDRSGATDAALAADGDVLVAGWTVNGVAITKIKPNGAVDASFGNNGARRIDVNRAASAPQIEVTSSGQLVVAWSKITDWDPQTTVISMTRLRPDGSTIRRFGDNGLRTVDIWRNDDMDSMAIAPDDRVYIAAWSEKASQPRGVVSVVSLSATDHVWTRRYNPYGRHGTQIAGISVDSAGRAVVGITPTNAPGVGAMRVNPDGSLDDTYSGDGVARASCNCFTTGSVLTTGGVVIFGGNFKATKLEATRFTTSGQYDTTFGGGEVYWDLFDGAEFLPAATVDATGRLLLGGTYGNKTGGRFIARVLTP